MFPALHPLQPAERGFFCFRLRAGVEVHTLIERDQPRAGCHLLPWDFDPATDLIAMTPTALDDSMYHELREDIRGMRRETADSIKEVANSLDAHLKDETVQYARVTSLLASMDKRLTVLEGRWGLISALSAIIGAGVMALVNKIFFP